MGFIGPTYQLSSVNVDCQRCINLYPEINELGTGKDKEIASLISTPGLNLLATLPTLGHRGSWVAFDGTLYMVVGSALYKVNSDFTYTSLGDLSTSAGPVSMADNGIQLVIVDGTTNCYSWDFVALTFSLVALPVLGDFGSGAGQVTYQDGFFVFNLPGSPIFYISGQLEVTFDGADLNSKTGKPDNLVALLSDHRNLWLFGSKTTEIWFDAGGTTTDSSGNLEPLFPFQRNEGTFIQTGCAAPFSIAALNGNVIWLGSDQNGSAIVYGAGGFVPERISNQSVEEAFQSYSVISDAVAWTYEDSGHSFYVLNFPTANATWVFDTQTKLWHERNYLINGVANRHRGQTHALAYGKHVIGDWENGNIYELTSAAYSDNGQPIQRRRRSPHISTDMARQFFSNFELDIEAGVGLDGTQQGTDPQAVLRWSDDSGHTWSNEKWASIGKIGQTKKRVQWQRLGSSRSRVFEVTVTDPVKVVILGAEINYMPGAS